ncbi:MAG: amidohydrolase family protein [Alphaproteobacteria bacterium]|nr:amidohydrolase family protein [Alphaproteobacteria bacterium]
MNEPARAYVNARLLDPASGLDTPGALLVDGGRIADCGPRLFAAGVPEGIEVVDCGGCCLAPGLVDMRAFLGEPGAEHKETIATGSGAAAAGGFTTVVALPNTAPVVDAVPLVELVRARARDSAIVNVLPAAALTKGFGGTEMTEMGLLAEAGAVIFTEGTRSVANAQVMRRVMAYASTFDLLVDHLPQEPTLADGVLNEGEVAARLGLAGSPACAETIMLGRDLTLVELTGCRYHASHLSTAAGVALIREAKARGLPVSCSASPHHLTLTEDAVGQYRTFAKVVPPLRTEADRLALIAGLADGTIDVIASGHSPENQESKRLPFAQAAPGISGLETALALSLGLYHCGATTLLRVLATLTSAPAARLGLEAGTLRRRAPADLIVFDLDRDWLIEPEAFHSKSKNSPFEKMTVRGRVLRTVVAGRHVYRGPAA